MTNAPVMDGLAATLPLVSIEAEEPSWTPPNAPDTLTGALLDDLGDTWTSVLRQLGSGLALSVPFGVALGMRDGGVGLLRHGAGVPLGFSVVALLATPALFIGLLHAGVSADPQRIARALSRSAGAAGLVLAGLSPLAALVAVTGETVVFAAVFGWFGLLLAGVLGLRQLARDISALLGAEPAQRRLPGWCVAGGFGLLSALLAVRVWASAMPLLTGGVP